MNALAGRVLCWRLERRDGAGLGLTSHDEPLLRDGTLFRPAAGITPASVARDSHGEDDGDVAGAISDSALDADELALGRWTGATARLTVERWDDETAPQVVLAAGELGEVATSDGRFTAQLRGVAARLAEEVCPSTAPHCRAALGDPACSVDLAGRRMRGKIMSGAGTRLVLDRAIGEGFRFGRLRVLSGELCGLSSVILAVDGTQVTCRDPWPRAPEAGCVVEVEEGCDRRLETCRDRFANAANFRGEPHLPGTDLLTRYPGG